MEDRKNQLKIYQNRREGMVHFEVKPSGTEVVFMPIPIVLVPETRDDVIKYYDEVIAMLEKEIAKEQEG